MDTTVEFLLSDATLTNFRFVLLVLGGAILTCSVIMFLAAAIDPYQDVLTPLLFVGVAGSIFMLGVTLNNHEESNLRSSTQDVINEIQDEYEIEVLSPNLHDSIKHFSAVRPEMTEMDTIEEVKYIYEGTVYSTSITVLYRANEGNGSVALYSPVDAESRGEMTPFTPGVGVEESTAPQLRGS